LDAIATPEVAAAPLIPSAVRSAERPQRTPRHARRIGALAVALGVFADLCFDGVPLGLGWPLFLGAAVVAFLIAGGREAWQQARPALWLLWPMAVSAGFVAVRDSPELTALNVAVSSLCLLLFAHFATAEERLFTLGPASLVSRALAAGPRALWSAPPTVLASLEGVPVRAVHGSLLALGRTMLVAVPIVLVFAGLLAAADPMFSALVEGTFDALGGDLGGALVSRTLTIAGASLAMAGVLSFALRRRQQLADAVPVVSRLALRTTATVLAMVSLLFVAFGLVQARFLFSADHSGLPEGLTYAAYAHQGFFQLVAVVVLTLLLILALGRWTRLESGGQQLTFNVLGTALVACTAPLWAAAVQRMLIYQEAYGATVLRVFVVAFLCAVGVLLAYRAVSLWVKPQWFGGGALALSLLSAIALNVANPDALVAATNLARPEGKMVVLDTWYLAQLSADAVPAVERGTLGMDADRRAEVLEGLRTRAKLRSSGNPASFNLARSRAQAP
jgi:Domain of unknown function (DUF4173)